MIMHSSLRHNLLPADTGLAATRLIRREDLVSCEMAFVDCKLPGSTPKGNYSIIGAGVTQSADQVINLNEPHGFAIGVAEMPHGITNNLHIHYTAEVFMVFRGEWLFRWGANGDDGEMVGRAGDVISIPTWIFRGFTNVGADDGWIFTALGRDDSGGVIWHPDILRRAAETGVFLTRDNMLIDTADGVAAPSDAERMTPLTDAFIATMAHYSVGDLQGRTTASADRMWSDTALLDSVLPGHAAEMAPVIGYGMTQDRNAVPKVKNSHGFSIEWLRIAPGQRVGPFRTDPKQVLILERGLVEVTLGDGSTATLEPWGLFAVPGGAWRTLSSIGAAGALIAVITSGDARALLEWDAAIVFDALAAGIGVDPNGYLAPAELLPFTGPGSTSVSSLLEVA